MWIFIKTGFVSAVYKDGALQIRARDKKSLHEIAVYSKSKIVSTPVADYPYRIETNRETFAKFLSDQVMDINYQNFKSEVEITRGESFVSPLHKVWDIMHDVEDKEARAR